jgi:hypothetical protein
MKYIIGRTLIHYSKPQNLWDDALARLSDDERQKIRSTQTDKRNVLNEVLVIVEEKKTKCMENGWKFKNRKGETVIVRGVLEKVVTWIDKFKDVGDLVVSYDPGHAALPWAATRFLLQV